MQGTPWASGEATVSVSTDTHDVLLSWPPASDFRTSLILPDLTRRFNVLQSLSGEPLVLDELKSKLAEQRAWGSQNQVTEGYADGEARVSGAQADAEDDDADPVHQSVRSSNSIPSRSLCPSPSIPSVSSTKDSQSSRRMSNNLFSSGKFRDQAYFLRNTNPHRGGRGAGPIAQSDSNASISTVESSARQENSTFMYSDSQSLWPTTPEGSLYTFSGSAPSNASTLSKDCSSRSICILGDQQSDYSSSFSKRLSKAVSPASLAFEQAFRELEGEDQGCRPSPTFLHAR
ncbi:hypothetical protein L226DRAFT_567204 [Lentinus tigrinus ALCF2SS1-7]|uniref:Uncharacterized protein n=1 Tax=Lentinus tigrinus ALCF2SS1-6 TaxID=1328759 RepID=A0A5C2SQF3_9APHY|nr:hypothetical protein L227DRAFT_607063 [Lentinus tigrinus ALCF2SS1-6]RPD79009.1 hypothetical protein L226DRAFT_567204 [Lentinus tigrinus ALCF2SS1-7]